MKARAIKKLYDICISAGGVKYTLIEAVSFNEAHKFCEDNQWCFVDENDFVWDLDYYEAF